MAIITYIITLIHVYRNYDHHAALGQFNSIWFLLLLHMNHTAKCSMVDHNDFAQFNINSIVGDYLPTKFRYVAVDIPYVM